MDTCTWGTIWALLSVLAVCCGQTEEDEKRPYKFAFSIEGYQHRSEEKDERGIIMGEYGFVTGDGVYHVTVYATDENGDFKILSMKNYYIGLPGEGKTPAPTGAPSPTAVTIRAPPPPSTTQSPILQHLQGLMGCSGCLIPDKKNATSTEVGGATSLPYTDIGVGLIDERFGEDEATTTFKPGIGVQSATGNKDPFSGPTRPGSTQPSRGPESGFVGDNQSTGGLPKGSPPSKTSGKFGTTAQSPQQNVGPQEPTSQGFGEPPSSGGISPFSGDNKLGEAPFTTGGLSPSNKPSGPTPSVFDKSPAPRPSEGCTDCEDIVRALLYKFNYTLKYHGHHESGYKNGDKEGDYFFNGRDGLGRNVEYIANEFGYQPNITLVDLGLESPDTPKEENEEPNELKGYEFKWFYNR